MVSYEMLLSQLRSGDLSKLEKNYTPAGYITTKLTSTSPDKEIKIVRKFRYEYIG